MQERARENEPELVMANEEEQADGKGQALESEEVQVKASEREQA